MTGSMIYASSYRSPTGWQQCHASDTPSTWKQYIYRWFSLTQQLSILKKELSISCQLATYIQQTVELPITDTVHTRIHIPYLPLEYHLYLLCRWLRSFNEPLATMQSSANPQACGGCEFTPNHTFSSKSWKPCTSVDLHGGGHRRLDRHRRLVLSMEVGPKDFELGLHLQVLVGRQLGHHLQEFFLISIISFKKMIDIELRCR